MVKRVFGRTSVAVVLVAAGLAGLAALWAVWPRTPGTSPLAALYASLWSGIHLAAGTLTWRGSRLAAPAFAAAMALWLPVFSFIFPDSWMLSAPPLALTCVVAAVGYWYLNRTITRAARLPRGMI